MHAPATVTGLRWEWEVIFSPFLHGSVLSRLISQKFKLADLISKACHSFTEQVGHHRERGDLTELIVELMNAYN